MENKHQKISAQANRIFSRKSVFSAFLTLTVMTLGACINFDVELSDEEVLYFGTHRTPEITIEVEPVSETMLTEGRIPNNIFLFVTASTTFGNLTYQWYIGDGGYNWWGDAIIGATERIFQIPTWLTADGSPYYYRCEVNIENWWVPVRSREAKVIVLPAITEGAE